jgi:hypothetical protein
MVSQEKAAADPDAISRAHWRLRAACLRSAAGLSASRAQFLETDDHNKGSMPDKYGHWIGDL